MRLRLVKLGGSLITDKRRARTVRRRELERLCAEIAEVDRRARVRTILGHGSGSFGHVAAARHGVHRGLRRPQQRRGVASTQAAAAALHRIVTDTLRAHGAAPWSLSPSSALVARSGKVATLALEPLTRALDAGLLPVTHGDVVMDREQGASIVSTETVLLAIARRLACRGVEIVGAFWFGDTDGIYDEHGDTLPRIGPAEVAAARRLARGSAATDVTGGMRHRLETACALARLGIPSLIADGRTPGLIRAALRGGRVEGTRVEP